MGRMSIDCACSQNAPAPSDVLLVLKFAWQGRRTEKLQSVRFGMLSSVSMAQQDPKRKMLEHVNFVTVPLMSAGLFFSERRRRRIAGVYLRVPDVLANIPTMTRLLTSKAEIIAYSRIIWRETPRE